MKTRSAQIVWFKRDLRVSDHAALSEAAQRGPVLPLYVAEPELWRQPDASARQWAFVCEALTSLDRDLASLGLTLTVRVGDAVDIFRELFSTGLFSALHAHEETGNGWTFRRDIRLRALAREHGIRVFEYRQTGAIRGLRTRNGWAAAWDRFMAAPMHLPPASPAQLKGIRSDEVPSAQAIGARGPRCTGRQTGGRLAAEADLAGFLGRRGRRYHREMSSPLTAERACSRLSGHLATGTLSMRQVSQYLADRMLALADDETMTRAGWGRALAAFNARLHWRCHFMQKLETQPDLEHRALHPLFEDIRSDGNNPEYLEAWHRGETGLPFVDACMRYLRRTGWINFRMRAMLVSVSAYHLWLDWRLTGPRLAALFTDYEPGIHYSQMQMQSGVTGMNTLRVYNPVKQGFDQDPTGAFIAREIPVLAGLPAPLRHEPWKAGADDLSRAGLKLGETYPAPIIDPVRAAKTAKDRMYARRQHPDFKTIRDELLIRHASRKPGRDKDRARVGSRKADRRQLSLDL